MFGQFIRIQELISRVRRVSDSAYARLKQILVGADLKDLRDFVQRLGLVAALIIAVLAPVAYLGFESYELQQRVQRRANNVGKNIEYEIRRLGAYSPENAAIAFDRSLYTFDALGMVMRLTSADGTVVGERLQTTILPTLSATGPVEIDGYRGVVRAEFTTYWLMLGTIVSVLISLVIAGGMYACFGYLPMRAFDRAIVLIAAQQSELEDKNLRLAGVLEHMAQGICMLDKSKRVVISNKNYWAMYGLTPDDVKPGTRLEDIVEARIRAGNYTEGSPELYRQERLGPEELIPYKVHKLIDGRHIALTRGPMPDGGWVITHQDISWQRRQQERLAFLAEHDPLTELVNRASLQDAVAAALAATDGGHEFALLCLDLDRFKVVNDTLGHQVGDELLRAVARRLKDCVRATDVVARLGGDEFVIVHRSGDDANALRLAERIVANIGAPYQIGVHTIEIGVSIGIAHAPRDGTQARTLLRNADLALYRAKTEGRGTTRVYAAEMDYAYQRRQSLEADLRKAIRNEELQLVYQPIVDAASLEIRGFEALVRWHSPTRGILMPADFIPIAEDTGFIDPLGEWVLDRACCEAQGWDAALRVAVNVSARQLKSSTLAASVGRALSRSKLAPDRLELEISETSLLTSAADVLVALHELRQTGVRVALDDFGMGYSSLGLLRPFTFDKIKLDRSFVRELGRDGAADAMLRGVANIVSGLGVPSVASGVETATHRDRVSGEGFSEMQGFLFSRPVSAEEARVMAAAPQVFAQSRMVEEARAALAEDGLAAAAKRAKSQTAA